ncbi:MAG: GatB/YqeY domain-containing protein [Bdellovibrionales bacterium]|nr:GatB/YqeY domain-containing protein [Bdellovibrionales bacterium]
MSTSISLRDRILADMRSAMKSKKNAELQALKLVYAECKNKEIELKTVLDDRQMISLLKKQVKQYEESIEQYKKGDHQEGVLEQKKRRDFIKSYLPKEISERELEALVIETIAELKVTSIKEMGTVMKVMQARTAGSADNRRLAALIKERLQAI